MDRIDAMKAFNTALDEGSLAGAETSAPRGTITLMAPAELEKVLYTANPHLGWPGRCLPQHRCTSNFRILSAQVAARFPQQLFAAGWSACFMSSMQLVAEE